ncbi:MAG: NnrS family protein [Myxococcales bacterium FL481]|nr:MAG: NnrS family protein [Myxococcales bacterium FL481]
MLPDRPRPAPGVQPVGEGVDSTRDAPPVGSRKICGDPPSRRGHTGSVTQELLTIRSHKLVASPRSALFATGFRVFFLAGALAALFPVALWLDTYTSSPSVVLPWSPAAWHGHEMVYGFATAIVIGFLTTAVPKWTSTPAASGRPLVVLFATWLVARVSMLFADALPAEWVLAASVAVYPVLLAIIARPILSTRNRRNYAFPVLLTALAAGDTLTHLPRLGADAVWGHHGVRLGLYVLVMMIVVVGGRIIPAFTNAAMQRAGRGQVVPPPPRWDALTPVVVAAALLAQLGMAPDGVAIPLLLVSAATLLARTIHYQPWCAIKLPLLWILHVGYAWVPVGLLSLAAGRFGLSVPESTALHGLAAGAVGCMILAMMARVSLGHTGRPLTLPRGMGAAFAAIATGAALRVFGPAIAPAWFVEFVLAASVAWLAGFSMFLLRYTGMLVRPRVDGRPG